MIFLYEQLAKAMDQGKDSSKINNSSAGRQLRQSRGVPSQSSHIQVQKESQPQQHQPPVNPQPRGIGGPPQSLMIDENNALLSSIIYDRTIKVPKMNYADHGSRGVAAFPAYHQLGGDENITLGVSGEGAVGIPADDEHKGDVAGWPSSFPSSVQMQLQMQQMMHQQQQSSLQNFFLRHSNNSQENRPPQQQHGQYQIMPPPPNITGVMGSGYASSMMGNNAVPQQFQRSNGQTTSSAYSALMDGSGGPPMWGGGLSNAGDSTMNDTSYTTLMHALNTQMSANQAAIHLMESHAETLAGEEIRAINDASMGYINNIGLNAKSNTPDTMISPGEMRNGKKRVSPSIPLHTSQLIGGAMGSGGGTEP